MHFDQYQTLKFDRLGKVLQVTLNRPDKLNAVDEQMHGELACVFSDVANDPDSEIIVLTGAGRAFSAGGDIDWMQKMIDIDRTSVV
jgi:enoyl-CoA hydratase